MNEPLLGARPSVIPLPPPPGMRPLPVAATTAPRRTCWNWTTQILGVIFSVILVLLYLISQSLRTSHRHPVWPPKDVQLELDAMMAKSMLKDGTTPQYDQALLHDIHKRIARRIPDVTSYSLGYDPNNSGRFLNVIMDGSTGELLVKENEPNPIGLQSNYILLHDHGTVTPDPKIENAYRISGMGDIVFQCPNGFTGYECRLSQFCNGHDDVGMYKPVTLQLFDTLNINVKTRNRLMLAEKENLQPVPDVAELVHPRIRMYCSTADGGYILESCPPEKLLDANLNCQLYDTCGDRLSGTKHTQNIDPTNPLNINEYYMCENHKSVRKECAPNTYYSNEMYGCITNIQCFNSGKRTIPIDNQSYWQCSNDSGSIVVCPKKSSHVDIDPNTESLYCRPNDSNYIDCVPQVFEHEFDSTLKFKYGQRICSPESKLILCDTTQIEKHRDFTWGEDFQYTFKHWPRQVLTDYGTCTNNPDTSIIVGPVDLRYSSAMNAAHPFDFRTMSYVCTDPKFRYRWDYINNYIVDLKTQEHLMVTDDFLVSTSAPCQEAAQNLLITPPHFKTKFLYPPLLKAPFIFIAVPVYTTANVKKELNIVNQLGQTDVFWPAFVPNTGYVIMTCSYVRQDTFVPREEPILSDDPDVMLLRTVYNKKYPPNGFYEAKNTKTITQLELIGYPDAPKNNSAQHYYIASGVLNTAVLAKPDGYEYLSTLVYPVMKSIATNVTTSINFTFNWNLIVGDLDILPNFKITKSSFYVDGVEYDRGFLLLTLAPSTNNKSILSVGDVESITFDPSKYPTLSFINNENIES